MNEGRSAKQGVTVRPAVADDAGLIYDFVLELARYERAEHEVVAGVEDIKRSIFGEGSVAFALIGEVGGEAAGFAVYFYNYSTWLGRKGLYLEDLFVTPGQRGTGLGKALLRHLAGIALDEDCGRFEWAVLDWNEPAIGFYQRVGALPQDEWTSYRLAGDKLVAFARGTD